MRALAGVIAALCAFIASAAPSRADDVPDTTPDVLERARPEYDARGIRMGSFFLYPALTAGGGYTDNVFNEPVGTGDYFYTLAPQLKLQSAWSRHELSLTADANSYWYGEQSSEERLDWNLGAAARFDIVRGADIKFDAALAQLHDPRGTDLTGGLALGDPAEPTEYARSHLGAEIGYTFNRVRISLGGGLTGFDYEDTPQVDLPTFLNNDDRDRTVTDFFAKLSVKASEDTAIFLRGRVDDHDFDAQLDDDGVNRDSSGTGIDGGFEFRMTHVLVGEVFAGYTLRSFDNPLFVDANELAFGAGLKWFPSMLTTVRLDAARTVEDTSITGASSFVSTRGEVGLDHEFLRNFILSGRIGYENAEYLGVGRDDDILHGSLSGRYLLNNSFHLDAGYEYIDRSSTVLPFDYSTGQFQLSLTGKM